MRRFVASFLLGTVAAWLGSALIPGVVADRSPTTYLLVGLLLALGELVLPFVETATAIIVFFLPRPARVFLLRAAEVAIVARLVSGFEFSAPQPLLGLVGYTLLLTIFFLPLGR